MRRTLLSINSAQASDTMMGWIPFIQRTKNTTKDTSRKIADMGTLLATAVTSLL